MKVFRRKRHLLFNKWNETSKIPNHAVQIALTALLLTAASGALNNYLALDEKHNAEVLYVKQISREIWSNIHQIKQYESQDDVGNIQIPIFPVMTVYEAGLQNGMIVKLPPSTQNSLFTAYTYSQRVIQQSSDYSLENYGTEEYKKRNVFINVFINTVKINLEDTYKRGLYIVDSNRIARDFQLVATTLLFTAILLQLGWWAMRSILTHRI